MKFIIKTPKGTEIEMEENTEVELLIDGVKYIIKITKENGNI